MKTIAERHVKGVYSAMKRLIQAGSLLFALTGCSVFMAAKVPDRKNLDVFTPGVPRAVVMAEMGAPSSYDDRNGVRSEVYKFKQGYSQQAKISRAVLHGTADILTFGLALLCMIRDAFRLDIEITPDEQEVSDRSMVGDAVLRVTGYRYPNWPVLVDQLANDPTPYEKWR